MQLHIPNPCHEDWNQMLPEEQGRHCQVCCKTVVDFTGWEPEAISDYLMQRTGEKVCGRFNAHQLHQPVNAKELNWPALIGVSALSYVRKVAAVIVVVFGLGASSCNTGVQGQMVAAPEMGDTDSSAQSRNFKDDTVLMGEPPVAPIPECDKGLHFAKPAVKKLTKVTRDSTYVLVGDVNVDAGVDSVSAGHLPDSGE